MFRMSGKVWIKQMIVSAFILPAVVCGTAFFINFIAIYYHASRAIPFGTMVAVTCICLFVILPLTLVGTVLGRNLAGTPDYPCRINAVPRPIPEKKWFMEPWVIVALGGILPFGSIFIEMYFIFTSFWAYKIYYVYGFMLLGLSQSREANDLNFLISSFPDIADSDGMRDYRLHLFSSERGGLQVETLKNILLALTSVHVADGSGHLSWLRAPQLDTSTSTRSTISSSKQSTNIYPKRED